MISFSTIYPMLLEIRQATVAMYLAAWRVPDQLDLNVGDWEEVRLYAPGVHVGSKTLFGIPVQTWLGLGHGEFRLRLDGEIVIDSANYI